MGCSSTPAEIRGLMVATHDILRLTPNAIKDDRRRNYSLRVATIWARLSLLLVQLLEMLPAHAPKRQESSGVLAS
jgi:hypothetical protein